MIVTDISLRHTDSTSAYNFTMEVLGYIGGYTSMVPCMWFNLFHYSLLIGLRVVALPLCVASVTQATGCLPVTMSWIRNFRRPPLELWVSVMLNNRNMSCVCAYLKLTYGDKFFYYMQRLEEDRGLGSPPYCRLVVLEYSPILTRVRFPALLLIFMTLHSYSYA